MATASMQPPSMPNTALLSRPTLCGTDLVSLACYTPFIGGSAATSDAAGASSTDDRAAVEQASPRPSSDATELAILFADGGGRRSTAKVAVALPPSCANMCDTVAQQTAQDPAEQVSLDAVATTSTRPHSFDQQPQPHQQHQQHQQQHRQQPSPTQAPSATSVLCSVPLDPLPTTELFQLAPSDDSMIPLERKASAERVGTALDELHLIECLPNSSRRLMQKYPFGDQPRTQGDRAASAESVNMGLEQLHLTSDDFELISVTPQTPMQMLPSDEEMVQADRATSTGTALDELLYHSTM
jgi:hypothetical protein